MAQLAASATTSAGVCTASVTSTGGARLPLATLCQQPMEPPTTQAAFCFFLKKRRGDRDPGGGEGRGREGAAYTRRMSCPHTRRIAPYAHIIQRSIHMHAPYTSPKTRMRLQIRAYISTQMRACTTSPRSDAICAAPLNPEGNLRGHVCSSRQSPQCFV